MDMCPSLDAFSDTALRDGRGVAVYLHIPFCLSRCGYCSFFSRPFSRSAQEEYLGYLRREIDLWQQRNPALKQARTLYFGGGTPSLLEADQIKSLCGLFDLAQEAEVTLEINPIQITAPYLQKLGETPVNRLSIGLQSMDDKDLAWLGRRHRSDRIPAQIRLCRDNGLDNLSLDLIYGLPGQDVDSIRRNLDYYLALSPDHISAYLLTPDPDTPLGRDLTSGAQTPLPDEDDLAAQYDTLRETLIAAGFEHYEISNFCRPGMASRHNLTYWKSKPWLAVGASASGWLPPLRYTNPADLDQYYHNIDTQKMPEEAGECSLEQACADHIMMGLRLLEGLDLNELQSLYQYDLRSAKVAEIAKLSASGLLALEGDRLRLTDTALFVSNAVIGELL